MIIRLNRTLSLFISMNKQIYIISGLLAVIASIICLFFNWRFSTGIIIGVLSSFIYFYLLNGSFKINEDGSIGKGGIIKFIIRICIIALPLLISFLLPDYFNIFGAFAGVMIFRIVMIAFFFKKKGEI